MSPPRGIHGVLVVDKQGGPTSHDVVERVRLHVRPSRAGHTGTLDPMATGVLIVCVGAATRLSRFLSSSDKEYRGEIMLGVTTDTFDAEGRILESRPTGDPGIERIREQAATMRGEFAQVPPPWSAKRTHGRRAYDLARSGRAPVLAPCRVRIEAFEILDLIGPRASFRVVCSSGTYVRSLAHDLGQALGCGAHLSSLRRTRSGEFTQAMAHSLDEIEEAGRARAVESLMIPIDDLRLGLSEVRVTREGERRAMAGRRVPPGEWAPGTGSAPGKLVRLVSETGRLIALAEAAPEGPEGLQPRVVLPEEGGPAGS